MKEIESIINCLNSVCCTSFKPTTKATQAYIKARLKEGFKIDDFKHVICFKAEQWKNDPVMSQYLRPETLFCAKHFEGYLQAALKVSKPVRTKPEVAL